MIKLRTNLKKEEIAGSKGYMKWYRVFEDELRLFINEGALNENNEPLNKFFYKENRVELCRGGIEYSENFYEKHKHLKVKFFFKPEGGNLYTEYEVKDWRVNENGIEVLL